MIDEKTQNLINERFLELPNEIQDAITDSDWQQEVRNIVSKNKLLIDQGLVIENETFLMMLGVENPKNYTKNIKKEAKLTNEQAVNIALDVDEKILKKIKSKIIENQEKNMGMENNPLKDIIGPAKEVNEAIPDIDINLEDDNEVDSDRKDLINELGSDIEIEQDETEEELAERSQFEQISQNNKEKGGSTEIPNNLPTKDVVEKTIESKKIELSGDMKPNPRFIETDLPKQSDNLPSLEPVRTLESDSENRDEIVSSKLAGSEIKKPDTKPNTTNTDQEDNIKHKESITSPKEPEKADSYKEIIKESDIDSEISKKIPQKPETETKKNEGIPQKKVSDPYRESFE